MFSITLLSNNLTFTTNRRIFYDYRREEITASQAPIEEAEMRDRQKERKARTRRLIQEGAILEKVCPAAAEMDLTKLEDFLYWALR